jgi:microcystin-dependent protein
MKRIFNHHQDIRSVIASTALATTALLATFSAKACPAEAYAGQICMIAASYCPAEDGNGYVQPVGQQLSSRDYPLLFAVIGTTYGGNGVPNFNLPDLRGRSPVGTGQGFGLQNVTLGEKRGSDSPVTLTQAQMPSHSHTATYNPTGAGATVSVTIPVSSNTASNQTAPDSTHNYLAGSPASGAAAAAIWSSTMNQVATIQGVTGTVTGATGTVSVGVTGGGSSFSALPPQMGMTYCIATQGMYPQRPN